MEKQDGPSLESSSYLNLRFESGPLDLWTQRPWDSWTIGLWDLFPPIPPLLISSSYNILPLFISFFLLLLLPSTSFYFHLHPFTSSYLLLCISYYLQLLLLCCILKPPHTSSYLLLELVLLLTTGRKEKNKIFILLYSVKYLVPMLEPHLFFFGDIFPFLSQFFKCFVKEHLCLKVLLQNSHTKFSKFSLLCTVLICAVKLNFCLKTLSHCSHLNVLQSLRIKWFSDSATE